MSTLYLLSSAAISAVRRAGRCVSSLSNRVRTFQVANRSGFRIDVRDFRPQERDAQRVRLPVRESRERTMFGPPFLGPSSCEVSSAVPKKGCSVALEAAERVCRSSPRPQRPSHQSRQRAGYRLEASSPILNLPPSPVNPSPLDLGKKLPQQCTDFKAKLAW